MKKLKKLIVQRERDTTMPGTGGKRIVTGWLVQGERLHHVWRSAVRPTVYTCDCEAGQWSTPCKHISAVLRYEFRQAALYASVAHREDQARAHHRRMIKVSANNQPVWVTFRRVSQKQ